MVRRARRRNHAEPPYDAKLQSAIRAQATPLLSSDDFSPLLDRIGDARFVLLGEASHGTHEFYTWRAALSQRLIQEKGFSFVAVEGDWPDCYRVNEYVKEPTPGADTANSETPNSETARDVLHAFERWPTWMWANEEVAEFITWLKHHNSQLPGKQRAGFYGLDVYSLWDSLYQVLSYLAQHDPASLPAARRAFQCFSPYGEDAQAYARATRWVNHDCEDQVVELLTAVLQQKQAVSVDRPEAHFNASQNAWVLKNAEHYYRTMVQGGPSSWNIRDRHMVDTLNRLTAHHGPDCKAIIWEHNTHVGDARYTDMKDEGMLNVGQLVREQQGAENTVLVGFGTFQGTVIAAESWEAPMREMQVPPARLGSWEDTFHRARGEDCLLLLDQIEDTTERGHRAIGVVYHPEVEHLGNYVPTQLTQRYDAFIHLENTAALRPLHEMIPRHEGDVPETYPTGY